MFYHKTPNPLMVPVFKSHNLENYYGNKTAYCFAKYQWNDTLSEDFKWQVKGVIIMLMPQVVNAIWCAGAHVLQLAGIPTTNTQ